MDPYNELKKYSQWIICKDKLPYNHRDGSVCDAHNPAVWMSWDELQSTLTRFQGYREAFVFTAGDPFFFVDIDKCLINGEWSPLAMSLIDATRGALVEVSVSGTGLHIVGKYSALVDHACKDIANGIELYTEGRFMVLGNTATACGSAATVVDIRPIVDKYFQPRTELSIPWQSQPVPEWNGFENDDELLNKMLNAQGSSVFGGRATPRDLWEGNVEVLARNYPSQNDRDPYDRSSADAALLAHLAFWTGKNHQRMWDLVWRDDCKLRRDKWLTHRTYLATSITNAVSGCNKVYGEGSYNTKNVVKWDITPAARERGGYTVALNDLVSVFDPYIYIASRHVVFDKRTGSSYSPAQFSAMLGGLEFVMGVSAQTAKIEKNAFTAFTQNQFYDFPKVYDLEFMPNKPPGTIVQREGRYYVNSCVLFPCHTEKGDVQIALDHIHRMLPQGDDALILLCYMATVVRNPGRKLTWAPILVGAEGNGKSWVSELLEYAVGYRYTARPNARDITNKFNAWIEYSLFAIVDEINAHGDADVIDALKVLITSKRMEIQSKGVDARTGPNWANFLFMSNHLTGIPITDDTRRLCVLVCNQLSREDVNRDFPDPQYFRKLFEWTEDGGYAKFAHFLLHDFEIDPRYDPFTTATVAPRTSSTALAISKNRSRFQDYIQDAIEEERPGFCGGWISSNAIKRLLAEVQLKGVSVQKFADLLAPLGYIRHPQLVNGRVDNAIMQEGTAKPILFVTKNHYSLTLENRAAISSAFIAAQNYRMTNYEIQH